MVSPHFKAKPLTAPVVVGDWYWVPCVDETLYRTRWVPVLPNAHKDEGLDRLHYNLDVRFLTRRQMQLITPHSARVIPADGWSVQHLSPELNTPLKLKQCLRTGHTRSYLTGGNQEMFEHACAGRLMKNMTCPHKGTDLSACPIDEDGGVTCPAHGVRWHAKEGWLMSIGKPTTNGWDRHA